MKTFLKKYNDFISKREEGRGEEETEEKKKLSRDFQGHFQGLPDQGRRDWRGERVKGHS